MSSENAPPDIRTRLVEAAIRLLAEHGPSEVKARSVASEAGLSTMGVYSHFGGLPELLQAVADEGFRRQAAYFSLAQLSDDPMTNLCAMAFACRDFAQRNPHLYDLMFGLSIQGRYSLSRSTTEPSSSARSPAFGVSYAYLHDQCARLVETHCIRDTHPVLVAAQFWSALHGFIMLELGGHFADVPDPGADILVPMCVNLVVGLGATRDLAESSAAAAMAGWTKKASHGFMRG